MELIVGLLQGFVAVREATRVAADVYQWISMKLTRWGNESSAETIQVQVEKLGRVSEGEVRALVEKLFAGGRTVVPKDQREETIGILLNLTRSARFLATQGTLRSSYLRCERLLDQLLSDAEPVRRWGQTVAPGQPWVLQRYLGMGSFGEVWLARNASFPTPRAYKFFTRPGSGDWLRREQQNLTHLVKLLGKHDHIIEFIDVLVDEGDTPFLALEYAGGGSLEDWIVEDPARRPRLDKHEVIRGITSGLAAAHGQRIAHRDLKPANVLLTDGPDVQAKVADFGLAKVAGKARGDGSALASRGSLVGTSLYLPPEAQQGMTRRLPEQDDVFALGAIWYQLLTESLERPPYDFAERLRARGVDTHTIGLIERCLAHPDRRFPNAAALEVALGDELPPLGPCPAGQLDVQHVAREYLATLTR